MNVLITDHAWPSLEIEREQLAAAGAQIIKAETGDEDELVALAPSCDAILTCWKPVTARVLDAAPRCQVVGRYGVGLDNIAVDHATELGILVTSVPDFCVDEVSDHALALILALTRGIVVFAGKTRHGGWDHTAGGTIRRLRGQILGLVGCGRIGRATGEKARAFGMRVLACTRSGRVPDGTEPVADLDELLTRADVVSLHLPLTPESEGLINEARLRHMKPSAFLVNTSRGAIVDQNALIRAIREGRIGGAGLDVLALEPPSPDNPLLASEAVIVTPHASFYSEESIVELRCRAATYVAAVLRGDVPETVVNPEVLDRTALRMSAPLESPQSSSETLDDAAVIRHLRARGLVTPEMTVEVHALRGGVSCEVRAVVGNGLDAVVKRAHEELLVKDRWFADGKRMVTEGRALRLAGDLSPDAVPRVIDLDPRTNTLVMQRAPRTWRNWRDELMAGRVEPEVGERLGHILAHWHQETASRPELLAALADDASFIQLRIDPFHRMVASRHPELVPVIEPVIERLLTCRTCLVHGDFSPKNILVGNEGLWVLDWEAAHVGDPDFDLAYLLCHLVLKTVHRPVYASGYRETARRFLAAIERNPDAHLASNVGCLLLARVDGKSPADYLTHREQERVLGLGSAMLRSPAALHDYV